LMPLSSIDHTWSEAGWVVLNAYLLTWLAKREIRYDDNNTRKQAIP